jgi:hypothetical protein
MARPAQRRWDKKLSKEQADYIKQQCKTYVTRMLANLHAEERQGSRRRARSVRVWRRRKWQKARNDRAIKLGKLLAICKALLNKSLGPNSGWLWRALVTNQFHRWWEGSRAEGSVPLDVPPELSDSDMSESDEEDFGIENVDNLSECTSASTSSGTDAELPRRR